MSKKIKSVAFNLGDPYERKIYEHACLYPVFSAYVKRLIQKDLEAEAPPRQVVKATNGVIKLDLR